MPKLAPPASPCRLKLWLVRHAPVQLPAGICYGHTDVAAHPKLSHAHAAQLALQLPQGLPVWTSSRQRTQQLAQALMPLRPDLHMMGADARLDEINFGTWELKAWNAIPKAAFDAWIANFAQHRFGGQESTQALLLRVAQAAENTYRHCTSNTAHASHTPNTIPAAIWITHAGVMRAAQWLATNSHQTLATAAQWPQHAPEPGGLMCLDWH